MKKDVIYIDVEDDITAIVGKMKASKEKIIALVPPNRVGVLQSAVNMRLLKRTAEQASKHVVIISNNQSLAALAAAARIPVAKNLQSRPEIAEVPLLKVDDDDVIDGQNLPVGELAGISKSDKNKEATAMAAVLAKESATDKAKDVRDKPTERAGKKPKVPNFNSFRKKLLLIGGGSLLLISFLVWAIWFAPRATVIITAKTTSVTVDSNVKLTTSGTTSVESGTVRALKQEQTAELSVEFTATGKKKVGDKAKGRVAFSTDSISMLDKTIPAGTTLTVEGMKFTTDSSVTFTRSNNNDATVGITAVDVGEEYNGVSGRASGAPSGVSATVRSETSGGSSREITVVSSDDVKRATDLLNEKKDDSLKSKLESAFGGSVIVIGDSYSEKRSSPAPSVAVDSEASGQVALKTTLTATMLAIEKTDLETFLKGSIQKEIEGKQSQKIYSDGADQVKFAQFVAGDADSTVRITANGSVGPEIDEEKVKDLAKGKSYGEIQSALESIGGVEDVDTKFWPFWVRTVPNDVKRITIEFKLNNAS